jgi:hypothetical protein
MLPPDHQAIIDYLSLPKEIIWLIGSKLNHRSLIAYHLISKGFYQLFNENEITEILRTILHRETSLILTTYTRKELEYLSLFKRNQGRMTSNADSYLVITSPDEVIGWGQNTCGELGSPSCEQDLACHPIAGLKKIKMVAIGHIHSLALDEQGKVYGFGYNSEGQLGLGSIYARTSPTLIPGLSDITAVFAQNNSSLALTTQGRVYGWGVCDYLGLENYIRTPRLLGVEGIVDISLGNYYVLFLLSSGQVLASGLNYNSRMGLIKTENNPFLITKNHSILITQPENIVGVTAAARYSLFLDHQGRGWVLGNLNEETHFSGWSNPPSGPDLRPGTLDFHYFGPSQHFSGDQTG